MKKIFFLLAILWTSPLFASGLGLGHQDWYLTIEQSALNKEFLFMPTRVNDSAPKTETQSYQPKIVYFRRLNGKLFLFESLKDKTIVGPYQPEKILAEFPVVSDKEEKIVFDFKAGMETLIVEDEKDHSIPVAASYLRDFIETDSLFSFYHVMQTEDGLYTLTWNHTFRRNIPNEGFMPMAPDPKRRVGFFEVAPALQKGTGKESRIITRWDIRKPIIFHISSNTPAEYRETIREGILDWNNAFGLDIVRAEDAPAGILIGDPRYNMVQWIDWDDAPYAFADLQAHPQTGEILHANIFFPSRFAVGSKERLKKLLKVLKEKKGRLREKMSVKLSGFESFSVCRMEKEGDFYDFLNSLRDSQASDAVILRLSQNYVRNTIRHEVGHNLGLEHNFKGSLASNIPLDKDRENLNAWMESDQDGISPLPSSSVMDYLDFRGRIRMYGVGLYDKAAVRYAYLASPEEREVLLAPPYCSDDQTSHDALCAPGDASADPVGWSLHYMQDLLDRLPGADADEQNLILGELGGMLVDTLRFVNAYQAAPYEGDDVYRHQAIRVTDFFKTVFSEKLVSSGRENVLSLFLQSMVAMPGYWGGTIPFEIWENEQVGPAMMSMVVEWLASLSEAEENRLLAATVIKGENTALGDWAILQAKQRLWKNVLEIQQSYAKAKTPEAKTVLENRLAQEQALLAFMIAQSPQ